MYFYIFSRPEKIVFLPKAPSIGSQITQTATAIISYHPKGEQFRIIKNRYGTPINKIAEKYLGIRLFDDGFFISDQEKMLFILKYSGLQHEKDLDIPII